MINRNRNGRNDRIAVAVTFGIIIAYSVWRQGNSLVVSLGAGALAFGLYAAISWLLFGRK